MNQDIPKKLSNSISGDDNVSSDDPKQKNENIMKTQVVSSGNVSSKSGSFHAEQNRVSHRNSMESTPKSKNISAVAMAHKEKMSGEAVPMEGSSTTQKKKHTSSKVSSSNHAVSTSNKVHGERSHNKEKNNDETLSKNSRRTSEKFSESGSEISGPASQHHQSANQSKENSFRVSSSAATAAVAAAFDREHFYRDARQHTVLDNYRDSTSFLEALNDDEKRTRTRHLPDVEGIRRLHKSEIKSDLKAARNLSGGNNANGVIFHPDMFSKSMAARFDKKGDWAVTNPLDRPLIDIIPDEEDDYYPENNGSSSTDTSLGGKIVTPFISPNETDNVGRNSYVSSSSANNDEDNSINTDDPKSKYYHRHTTFHHFEKGHNIPESMQNPQIIESMIAFNPPRPKESVASKKKRRLLEWEQNPSQVETDISNCKKSVERTQNELYDTEKEIEDIEFVAHTYRNHFLNQLRAIREESIVVNKEIYALQSECSKSADLISSRTRSFGGSNITSMKNILAVLDNRPPIPSTNLEDQHQVSGIGGVQFVRDENKTYNNQDSSVCPASGWILPGNKVKTPFGGGTVLEVYGVSPLDKNEVAGIEYNAKSSANDTKIPPQNPTVVQHHEPIMAKQLPSANSLLTKKKKFSIMNSTENLPPQHLSSTDNVTINGNTSSSAAAIISKNQNVPISTSMSLLLPPRVSVRLSYGIGYFCPEDVHISSEESPVSMPEAKLVQRWKSMTSTAMLVKDYVDSVGMSSKYLTKGKLNTNADNSDLADNRNDDGMEIDSVPNKNVLKDLSDDDHSNRKRPISCLDSRVCPFGSDMIQNPGAKGSVLVDLSIKALEDAIDPILNNNGGVLGKKGNSYVTPGMKYWEDQRYDLLHLKGKALQLRNDLYRQQKVRKLNDRGRIAAEERMGRIENLLLEMKADLSSLKERLQDELSDLGIDKAKAEEILASTMNNNNDGGC